MTDVPWSVSPLAAAGPAGTLGLPLLVLLYWIPYWMRTRTLAGEGRPVPTWRIACFAAGLGVLALALSPPVGTLSDQLLVAHMAEHLLIGDVAALLLVLGFTGPLLAPLLRNPVIGRLRVLAHPVVAVVLWGVNFYAWHLPALYQAALHPAPPPPRGGARDRARHLPDLGDGRVGAAAGPAAEAELFGKRGRARV